MNPDLSIILAQDSPPAQPPDKPGGFFSNPLIAMILIMVIFWVLLIRPQRRQQKALEELRQNLQIGDDVITAGGIHGQITGKSERTVTVRVGGGTKIRFEKSSISQVFPKNKDGAPAEESAEGESADSEEGEEASK